MTSTHKKFSEMDSRQKEAFNVAMLAAVLVRNGEFVTPIPTDAFGADVLAYNATTCITRAIQVKSRLSINKKYEGKGLYVAFPVWSKSLEAQDWYVIPHDTLADFWDKTGTESWDIKGSYHAANPSKDMADLLTPYHVGRIIVE